MKVNRKVITAVAGALTLLVTVSGVAYVLQALSKGVERKMQSEASASAKSDKNFTIVFPKMQLKLAASDIQFKPDGSVCVKAIVSGKTVCVKADDYVLIEE